MKQFAALVLCVCTLAFLPWALAAGNRKHVQNHDQPDPPVVDTPTVPDQQAVDRHPHELADLYAVRDGSGERWTQLLPEIKSERWRDFLVDPDARVLDYRERQELRGVELESRQPISKRPTESLREMPHDATGVLIVKFRDNVRARLTQGERVISRAGRNMQPIERLIDRLGLTVEPAFYDTEEDLAKLQARAAEFSGREQPDLAGMVHLTGPEDALVRAAQQLNEHDLVEFVEFEREYVVHYAQQTEGACCFPDGPCEIVFEEICDQIDGAWAGPNTDCSACGDNGACCVELPDGSFGCVTTDDAEECVEVYEGYFQGFGTICFDDDDEPIACDGFQPECGAAGTGGCVEVTMTPFCDFEPCCELVCEQDQFCCGELDPEDVPPGRGPQRWDAWCVQLSHELCGGDFAPPFTWPQCLGNTQPCTEPHPSTGCSVNACCNMVCDANPTCCTVQWDQNCVTLAEALCTDVEDPGDTPNFTPFQGYLTPGGYADPPPQGLGGIPEPYDFLPTYTAGGVTRPIPGFGGEGYDLPQFEDLAQLLWDEYGIGHNPDLPDQPTAKGETIRVGVIEHSAFVQPEDPETNNHEALQHVISEPGQTVLNIPGSANLSGNHGSASLGVVGGREFITGVASESEIYFFPIVSAEEGGRFGRAMTSAMEEFGPGDVLSFSIGPPGCATLASGQRSWMLLNMASDMGITCVISAGNDCCNFDDDGPAQFGDEDSDVIIVGAVYPGRDVFNPFVPGDQGGVVHNRLGFSNFCQACGEQNAVHVGAWGMLVTTAGYGALFVGEAEDTRLRSYTAYYNGTSAAAPQVAGVAARLQSFAKQFYGIPLTPGQIRTIIAENGIFQAGVPENRPDLVPGHATNPCLGSWSQQDEPDNIGSATPPIGLTMLFPAGEAIISSEFFDCDPILQEVHTIRGTHLHGNIFSICAIDDNFYVTESQPTSIGSSPSHKPAPWTSPLDDVIYNVGGHVADVFVVAQAPHNTVLGLSIDVVAQGPPNTSTLHFLQVYDWDTNHWAYVGSASVPAGAPVAFSADPALLFSPQRFFNDDGHLLIRSWAFAFNSPSGPSQPAQNNFQYRLDWVNVDVLTPGWDSDPVD